MKIDDILREHEDLRRQQSPIKNTLSDNFPPYPPVSAQDSLDGLVDTYASHSIVVKTESENSPPPKMIQKTVSFSDVEVHVETSVKTNGHAPSVTLQQTSVITSLPKRISETKQRQKSFQRQKSIDELPLEQNSPTTKIQSDKNNNNERHEPVHPTARGLTAHNVDCFIDNSPVTTSTKPKKIPMKANSQQDPMNEFNVYKHLARGFLSDKGKSRSLDMMVGDDTEYLMSHPYHIKFLPHQSYEDDQTARYIRDLHISPPGAAKMFPHPAFHNSPTGSPIGSPLRQSPLSLSGMRRFPPHESSPGKHMVKDNTSSIFTSQQPITYGTSRPPIEAHLTKSRSHEIQLQRQYKFAQKKSYSLNTAPYDLYEKNLRRILSEENVPENLLLSKTMGKHYPHLRRAASYETFSRFNPNHTMKPTPGRSHLDLYQRQTTPVKSTKIMFPEHDNVTDYNSIFTQPVEDENMHAIKINKIMEKSFQNQLDYPPPGNQSQFPSHHSSAMEELEKPTKKSEQQQKHHQQQSQHNTQHQQQQQMTKSKSLPSQSSIDMIGPYKYDPSIDNEVAVCVSGLLTLPGSNEKKYPISVGELRRRIAPPEFLNKVDMISYVRLAKTSARELLEKHAIRPKHHSRKSKHSVISKMCEAECTELANGIKTLSDRYFPKEWLATQVISAVQDDEDATKKQKLVDMQQKLDITRNVLKDLSSMLERSKANEEMQNYNLATHYFGMLNLTNNIDLITSFLQTQNDVIVQRLGSTEMMTVRDEQAMETESGFGSKSSSIDEAHY